MLYISYTETSEGEGVFAYLPDAGVAADTIRDRNTACQVTRIQKISKREGQPALDIFCFTVEPINDQRIREIADSAVDWLMEEGYLEYCAEP